MDSQTKNVLNKLELRDIIDYMLDTYDSNEISRSIANWFVPEECYIQKSKMPKQTMINFSKQQSSTTNDEHVTVVAKKHTKPLNSEKVSKNKSETKLEKVSKTKNIAQTSNDDDDDELKIKVNVGRLKKNKQASTKSKFHVKELKFKSECDKCTGYLASGKPCTKTKIVEYGMCTRCSGELKEKGPIVFDEVLGHFYRDVKFTVDDPNGLFFKGQEIRQYSKYSRTFDFNGTQCHRYYYIFTHKDVLDDFKSCTFIVSSSPFVKGAVLKKRNIEKYRLIVKPELEKTFENIKSKDDNDDDDETENDTHADEEEEDKDVDVDDVEYTDIGEDLFDDEDEDVDFNFEDDEF
jgi:hypothetical protein